MGLLNLRARENQKAGRGEVWLADLDQVVGHELAGRRPVLVVSEDFFNRTRAGLLIVVPITSTLRPFPSRVRLIPPEGGLKLESDVLCEAIRSISKQRLLARYGSVEPESLGAVEDRLRLLLRL
jgi:mRNA interferase MazF